jgi:hypothetical protein
MDIRRGLRRSMRSGRVARRADTQEYSMCDRIVHPHYDESVH